ncbi:MAG: rRNA pseudouridine synthase [Oscillospiraceae bacterium]|nr:rRNA pseudouridine synthase [Oscillospiraceae bacterium]
MERLDKILSHAGYGSRTDVKKLIRSGAVSCGGAVVRDPEQKFDADEARISVDGCEIKYSRFIYLMMNKPGGVISATYDPVHRTVVDLLPDSYRRRSPFPVGRLDIDTTGLLLLTDDGDLAHRLLSPKKHVEKEYEAVLDRLPCAKIVDDFAGGVVLDGHIALRPAKLLLASDIHSPTGDTTVRVVVTEGKYHQVKRMFLLYGINVLALKRVRMGGLALDPSLAPGEFRELTPTELSSL